MDDSVQYVQYNISLESESYTKMVVGNDICPCSIDIMRTIMEMFFSLIDVTSYYSILVSKNMCHF